MPEQFGVPLCGAFVVTLDGVGVACPLAQPGTTRPPAARAVNPANGMVRRTRPCGTDWSESTIARPLTALKWSLGKTK